MFFKLRGYFNVIGRPGTIPALDGLRALAIILVLLRHGIRAIAPDSFNASYGISAPLNSLAFNGWLGVDLFFVLSGFLISRHLLNQCQHRPYEFKTFYLGRALRTLPLYYAALLLVFIGISPWVKVEEAPHALALLKYLMFLQDYLGSAALVPLWSLAVEEKFYLLAPLIVAILAKLPAKLAASMVFLAAGAPLMLRVSGVSEDYPAHYSAFFWQYRAPFHLCLDGMLLGMCAAWLVHYQLLRGFMKHKSRWFYLCLLLAGGILCWRPWLESESWMASNFIIFGFSMLCAIAICCAATDSRLSTGWLGGGFCRFFARISYAAYLLHYLCIPAALNLAANFNTELAAAVFWFCYLLLTISASVISHLAIEKPFLLIKKSLSQPTHKSRTSMATAKL